MALLSAYLDCRLRDLEEEFSEGLHHSHTELGDWVKEAEPDGNSQEKQPYYQGLKDHVNRLDLVLIRYVLSLFARTLYQGLEYRGTPLTSSCGQRTNGHKPDIYSRF